jgi:hypothetical protein
MAVEPFVGPWQLFQFLYLFTQSVELLGLGISWSQGRYLHTGQHKRTQTSTPQLGFEPTIPVVEWAKTFHASDRAAPMIGFNLLLDSLVFRMLRNPVISNAFTSE